MQNKERQMLKQKKRVVIKIGSSSLTHPEDVYKRQPLFHNGRLTDLSVSVNNIFGRGQLLEPHGASGVQLLSADADLRSEAELLAVRKPRGGVDIHGRRVHLI